MSKVTLNGKIFSNEKKEYLNNIKAIKNDNIIVYNKDNIKTTIKLLSNKVLIERENDALKLNLEFEENKSIVSNYLIKEFGMIIKVKTKTNKLIVNESNFKVEYDLFMDDNYSDNFVFELDWRDLK